MFCWPGCREYEYVKHPELFVLDEDMGVSDIDGEAIFPANFVGSFPRGCWVIAEVTLSM